ncbi:hypothetical protein PRABACTJOHN_03701 [Parabacteroides johnsonii DSM 18315]|uniref:Uncharacterized protein n=1 Tax=Parabacteroides johnsonii DSM 18315 TaxID=537006 RepID=B7BF72_9BACT|nr:hypothetical protein PRABACTJOHN_03701 [Parabacteroides johnsonii DSM 18315]
MFGRSIGKSGAGKYGVSILKKVPRERGLFYGLTNFASFNFKPGIYSTTALTIF